MFLKTFVFLEAPFDKFLVARTSKFASFVIPDEVDLELQGVLGAPRQQKGAPTTVPWPVLLESCSGCSAVRILPACDLCEALGEVESAHRRVEDEAEDEVEARDASFR